MHFRSLMLLPLLLAASVAHAANAIPLDPARVDQIAAMLPEQPQGLGPRITDRAAWEKIAALPSTKKILETADKVAKAPVPEQPDALYLLYTQTGDRDQWQNVAFDRRAKFQQLVLAECLTHSGRYLPRIKEYLEALCAEPTWVYPAHDGSLANFHGKAIDIDLGASTLGWNIATALWLLGDQLDPAARKLALENLDRRIVTPFTQRIDGKKPLWWWMTSDMNWNAVCFAGSVGTVLAISDRPTRARAVAAAETYIPFFLKGFTPDGYCTEGLGYWNYGYGRFTMLSEVIRRATGDKFELLQLPAAALPARFPRRIEIAHGIYPAFADCALNTKPDQGVLSLLMRRSPAYAGATTTGEEIVFGSSHSADLNAEMIFRLDPAPPRIFTETGTVAPPDPRREFFDQTGILIARGMPGSPCKMAVALKGGSNHESHNHNDVGSYVLVLGTAPDNARTPLLDPGPERYTARTFSAKRYDSKLLSSYGHSVPIVAGQLQREGKETDAKILKADFTDDTDTFVLDISKAYNVKELASLTRTWTFSRKEAGQLTITDKAAFTSPQKFATTLITTARWQIVPDGRLVIYDGPQTAILTITASGKYAFKPEVIRENAAVQPTRLVLELDEPSTNPEITFSIVPH